MSAIDRAFIKAYSDEADETVMPKHAHGNPSAASESKAGTVNTQPQHAPEASGPRKSASRTRRSASAAAIRAADPAVASASTMPEPNESVETHRPVSAAVAGDHRPKMVVGRRALQQLAENAAVPAPHTSFPQKSRDTAGQRSDASVVTGAAAAIDSRVLSAKHSLDSDSRSVRREPVSSAPAPLQQLRVDPISTASDPRRSSDASTAQAAVEATIEPSEIAPCLEVDSLLWPPACDKLIGQAGADLDAVASLIAEQAANGSQCIAVVSLEEGDGCTTVALCLAQILSRRGTRICLVDGDFRHPRLGESLGVETDRGLESVLAGEVPLDEVLIESIDDQLTVLPLARPVGAEAAERAKLRQTVTFGELRDRFDAVLIDAGSVGLSPANRYTILEGGSADAVILVGRENADAIAWQRGQRAVSKRNLPCLGAIENRCAI